MDGGLSQFQKRDRETGLKGPEISIGDKNKIISAMGNGTNQKICIEALNPIAATGVEKFGSGLIIVVGQNQIWKGSEIVAQSNKLLCGLICRWRTI